MRLVEYIDGSLEIRWTWLPYWLAANTRLKTDLERELVATNLTNPDQLHDALCRALQDRFPGFRGLSTALQALRLIQSV